MRGRRIDGSATERLRHLHIIMLRLKVNIGFAISHSEKPIPVLWIPVRTNDEYRRGHVGTQEQARVLAAVPNPSYTDEPAFLGNMRIEERRRASVVNALLVTRPPIQPPTLPHHPPPSTRPR